MLSRLLRTPLGMLVRRIVLLYVVLMLCRVAFWIYNAAQLGSLTWSELGDLFTGALRFDTVSSSMPTACSSCCRSCRCTCANAPGTGACSASTTWRSIRSPSSP